MLGGSLSFSCDVRDRQWLRQLSSERPPFTVGNAALGGIANTSVSETLLYGVPQLPFGDDVSLFIRCGAAGPLKGTAARTVCLTRLLGKRHAMMLTVRYLLPLV